MAGPTPLEYVIRVKDDGTATIEKFNRTISQGLNQIPPQANNAANSVNNLNNSLTRAANTAANASSSSQRLKQSWLALSAQSYVLNNTLGFVKRTIEGSITGFNKYEDSVSRLRALTLTSTGEMSKGFEGLKNQALDMSNKFRNSALEINQAMSFMKQFGLTEGQINKGIKGTIDLATNELLTVQQAARVALQVQTSLGKGSEDLSKALDILTVASAESGASLTDLGESWKYVGINPKLQGVSLQETAAALMVFADAGIRGSMAGTTLRAALTRLDNPVAGARKALQELGLMTESGERKFENFIDVLRRLDGVANKSAFINKIFGLRATTGLTGLAEDMKAFDKAVQSLQDSEGRNARVAAEMNKGLAASTDRLVNSMTNLTNAIIERFFPGLKNLADDLATSIQYFTPDNSKAQIGPKSVSGMPSDMLFGPGWANGNEELKQFQREFLAAKNREMSVVERGDFEEWSRGVTLPGIRGIKDWNWQPTPGTQFTEDVVRKGLSGAESAWNAFDVRSLDPRRYLDILPGETAAQKAARRVMGSGFSGELPGFVTRGQKELAVKKKDPVPYGDDFFPISASNEKKMVEQHEAFMKMKDELSQYDAQLRAEMWFPESELEILTERMQGVNDIFLNAANVNERVFFESRARSQSNILSLVKFHSDAAKRQVDVERSKKALMLGIASEGTAALVDIFVKGEVGRFKAAKHVGRAMALIDTYQAANQVLADKSLPTVAKFGAVAAIVAAGIANVAKIGRTEIGSGGGEGEGVGAGISDFGGFDSPSFSSSPSSSDVVLSGSGRTIVANINVDGFVGSEATLASKIAEVLQEAVGDDINAGVTVSRGRGRR